MGARIVCLETEERALETAILAATLNILNYIYYRPLMFFWIANIRVTCLIHL